MVSVDAMLLNSSASSATSLPALFILRASRLSCVDISTPTSTTLKIVATKVKGSMAAMF